MQTVYICFFMFHGFTHAIESDEGPAAFTNGFWITFDHQLTKGEDCKFFITPNSILYIEKKVIADGN